MFGKPWKPTAEVLFQHRKNRVGSNDSHVSVIVTNYNYAEYVEECLNSIADQDHKELSLVVIDDLSLGDNSVDVIKDWLGQNKERFIQTQFLRNARNQGPSAARNTAFEHCPSDIVFIMDADNSIMPSAVGKLLTCLKRTQADAVYSQLVEFGDRRQVGGADIWDIDRMSVENYVDIMAMFKKTAWASVGGFTHIEEGWEDYDFWLKLIERGADVVFLPEILCRYRVHGTSRTAVEAYKAHDDLRVLMQYRHPDLGKRSQMMTGDNK